MTQYNGWTNYATWRVNLEIFDNMELGDFYGYADCRKMNVDAVDLADTFKEYTDDILTVDGASGLAIDYARAFISEVNWREIAQSMIDTYLDDYDQQAADEDTDDEELA